MWRKLKFSLGLTLIMLAPSHSGTSENNVNSTTVTTISTKPSTLPVKLTSTSFLNNTIDTIVTDNKVSQTTAMVNTERITRNSTVKADKVTRDIDVTMTQPYKNDKTTNNPSTNYNQEVIPMSEICPRFKTNSVQFNLESMVDVWQTLYYKKIERIQCFKIYVKRLTDYDKGYNHEIYGNFGGEVDWSKVDLEIKSSTKIRRKHFLQTTGDSANGVLRNIIILDKSQTGKLFFIGGSVGRDRSSFVLKKEVADQWLVYQNLLMMRDCENGGVLVFSRVPISPTRENLKEALMVFGKEFMIGSYSCPSTDASADGDELAMPNN